MTGVTSGGGGNWGGRLRRTNDAPHGAWQARVRSAVRDQRSAFSGTAGGCQAQKGSAICSRDPSIIEGSRADAGKGEPESARHKLQYLRREGQ